MIRTLVVEDDFRVAELHRDYTERVPGFTVVGTAMSGAEALQLAATLQPDLLLLDIHLPDINGLVLAQKLRDRFGPATPIIVVSGDTSMETLKSLPHVGATYFFSKPVNSGMLIERLKELIQMTR